MRSGFCLSIASAPRPRRCITPGRKFSTRTSARPTRSSAISSPLSCWRSSTMLRLPRFTFANIEVKPPRRYHSYRSKSPRPGGSTLMTSAPWSANIMAASGPEMTAEKSTTRIPASGPGILKQLAGEEEKDHRPRFRASRPRTRELKRRRERSRRREQQR